MQYISVRAVNLVVEEYLFGRNVLTIVGVVISVVGADIATIEGNASVKALTAGKSQQFYVKIQSGGGGALDCTSY